MNIKTLKNKIRAFLFPTYALKRLYKKHTKKKLDLKNPKTFNEKIQWLKRYELPYNSLVIECTDKYRMHDYLKRKGFSHYSINILGCWDNFDQIPINSLPDRFVLKINNGSSLNIFIENKQDTDWSIIKKQIKKWMRLDYGLISLERHYSKIDKKIISEPYLNINNDNLEYRFFCFNGSVKFCRVVRLMNKVTKDLRASCYSLNWEKLALESKEIQIPEDIVPPETLPLLIKVCEEISKDFTFIRIDFTQYNEKLILGELTFSPDSGLSSSFTDEAQQLMGEWLDLSKCANYK